MDSEDTEGAGFHYEVTVNAEGLEAAGGDFFRALQLQSRRLEDAQNRIFSRRWAFWILRVLCPLAGLLGASIAYQRRDSTPRMLIWTVMAVVFAGLAVAFWSFSYAGAQARLRQWTGRIDRSRVQKVIRRTRPFVPFKVSYQVEQESIKIHVDRPTLDVVIPKDGFKFSVRSGPCYLLFHRALSPMWGRILYAETPEQSEAVEGFLERHGIPIERLTQDEGLGEARPAGGRGGA